MYYRVSYRHVQMVVTHEYGLNLMAQSLCLMLLALDILAKKVICAAIYG
jgi:hypothetical protein